MHWIQRHILDKLMTHRVLRFSELRADDIESNLFQYHLRHIIRKGLVEKCEGGYQLAPAGLYYADRFSPAYKGERPQPKLVTVVIVKDCEGRVLLTQKQRQPWLGDYHLPAGKIHTGESTDDAAKRELEEKTGLLLDDVWFRCLAHIQIVKSSIVVSDYFGFLFAANYDGEVNGGCWYDPSSASEHIELAPSVYELLEFERKGDGRFHSAVIELV